MRGEIRSGTFKSPGYERDEFNESRVDGKDRRDSDSPNGAFCVAGGSSHRRDVLVLDGFVDGDRRTSARRTVPLRRPDATVGIKGTLRRIEASSVTRRSRRVRRLKGELDQRGAAEPVHNGPKPTPHQLRDLTLILAVVVSETIDELSLHERDNHESYQHGQHSVKSECLHRILPLGEKHLRAAVHAFVDHYHEERPHQGLGNELIAPKTTSLAPGPVQCRERLGGVLKFYYREAA